MYFKICICYRIIGFKWKSKTTCRAGTIKSFLVSLIFCWLFCFFLCHLYWNLWFSYHQHWGPLNMSFNDSILLIVGIICRFNMLMSFWQILHGKVTTTYLASMSILWVLRPLGLFIWGFLCYNLNCALLL